MPDAPSSEMPDPATLRSRALDLEAMTAMQMRNIDGLRRMVNLIFDSTQKITVCRIQKPSSSGRPRPIATCSALLRAMPTNSLISPPTAAPA